MSEGVKALFERYDRDNSGTISISELRTLLEEMAWARQRTQTEKGHKQATRCVATHGKFMWSGSDDTTVKLWSLGNNACETIGKHGDYAKCLSFAAEGGMLASAGFDRRLLLWDVQRFEQGRLGPVAGSEGGHSDSICTRSRWSTITWWLIYCQR